MLKRISIKGFKSFADPIALDLGPGLNVVVGPNGSGKSNLAEAIVWALGEQRAGRLRAPAMQDILYSGSHNRPAAGFAEISLQFDADGSGVRPEIEVSRRLTRNGDALYRVGHTPCRLLDVQEALSARGLGGESLAVIRQGQVEAIATSKPEARRAMLDEAAGVGVAKRRRKRADQKLARIAEKLDRARDLAAELGGRAKALERQARAAERAARLEDEIASLRERERIARAVAAAAALGAAATAHEHVVGEDRHAQAALEAARAERARVAEERSRATGALEHADVHAAKLRAATDRIAGRAELAAERVAELESREERLGRAKADAARRLAELEEAEGSIADELVAVARALEAAQAMLAAAEQDEVVVRAAEDEASEGVRRTAADLTTARSAIAAADEQLARTAAAADRARAELAQLVLVADDALAREERRFDVAERRLQRDHRREDAAQAAWDEATGELRAAEQRRREAAAAVRLLAPANGDDTAVATLGDGLEVERGMERAVGAALGALAEALLVASLDDAAAALAEGVPTVVVPAPASPARPAPLGAVALASVITECPPQSRAHVERLLADVWLVDDLHAVPAGHRGCFVTRDGVALTPATGVVSAARGEWATRALHRRAVEEEQALAASVERIAGQVAVLAAEREDVRRRRSAAERGHGRAATALAGRRAALVALTERRDRLQAELTEAEHGHEEARRGRAESAERADALAADLRAAEATLAAARDRVREAGGELELVRAAVRDARAAGSAVDARASEIQSAAAAARALLGAAEALPAGLALVARAAGALAAAAGALGPVADAAADALGGVRATFAGVEERAAAALRTVEAAEASSGASREKLHHAQVELRLAEERAHEAGPVPDEVPDELPDHEQAATQLADLERRRLAIGAVNELAAVERAELAEREEHLTEQIADLERSSASLAEHLGELDAAVDEGFEAIFNAVSDRFAEVVGLLFPGGTGRLRLVAPEDEDGEQGVEVEVVPANKRPRVLSLLSGGERSLIAMGFLLALAMAQPAPFYLLDEVEAALDDANLRRFLGVLRRLANETQFIVITHQQPTVEVADTLFGVTMGANGVSQILSRRLAQTVEGPARPYVRRQLRLVGS